MTPSTHGVDIEVFFSLSGAVFEARMPRWQELRVRWAGKASTVRTPQSPVMFDGAGPMTALAGNQFDSEGRTPDFDLGREQFVQAIDPPANHPVFVQVKEEGVKALVLRQDDALGLGCRLEGASQLKGDVEVKGVLACPLDLLEVHPGEPMSCGLLAGCFRRILLGAHVDDRPIAVVEPRKIDLVNVLKVNKQKMRSDQI